MTPELHVRLAGMIFLLLAAAHLVFPRRFNWSEELARLSLLNRQIFLVHCGFIVLVLVMFGVLSLVYTETLLQPSPLGRLVVAGLVIFWGARLLVQFFVYDRRLWQGNRFNTVMHVVFSSIWTYVTAVFAWVLVLQMVA